MIIFYLVNYKSNIKLNKILFNLLLVMDTLLKFLVLVKMVYIVATFVQPGITAGILPISNLPFIEIIKKVAVEKLYIFIHGDLRKNKEMIIESIKESFKKRDY